jgi:hypothetical protein
MTVRLELCPSCRSAVEFLEDVEQRLDATGRSMVYRIHCRDCGMTGPQHLSSVAAAEAWNELPRRDVRGGSDRELIANILFLCGVQHTKDGSTRLYVPDQSGAVLVFDSSGRFVQCGGGDRTPTYKRISAGGELYESTHV